MVGAGVGERVGDAVGLELGEAEGHMVGKRVGTGVVGDVDGEDVVGLTVGKIVGASSSKMKASPEKNREFGLPTMTVVPDLQMELPKKSPPLLDAAWKVCSSTNSG
jgi:hypothetical protein